MSWEHSRSSIIKTTINSIGRNFANYANFYDIRERMGLKTHKTCELCHSALERENMIHLALTSRGNKIICDVCLTQAESHGVTIIDANKEIHPKEEEQQ